MNALVAFSLPVLLLLAALEGRLGSAWLRRVEVFRGEGPFRKEGKAGRPQTLLCVLGRRSSERVHRRKEKEFLGGCRDGASLLRACEASGERATLPFSTEAETSSAVDSFAEALSTYKRSPYSKVRVLDDDSTGVSLGAEKGNEALLPQRAQGEKKEVTDPSASKDLLSFMKALLSSESEEEEDEEEEAPSAAASAPRIEVFPRVEPQLGKWISVGRVVRAHGLKGELAIRPSTAVVKERFLTPNSELYFARQALFPREADLQEERLGEIPKQMQPATPLQRRRVLGGRELRRANSPTSYVLLQVEGITDRSAAAALIGSQVYVPRSESQRRAPASFMLAEDLVGFEVMVRGDPSRTRKAAKAADDFLLIGTYKDVGVRELLSKHFKPSSPAGAPLLACGLHALGPGTSTLPDPDGEDLVLYECEGCNLRFTDYAAAVCHERLCLPSKGKEATSGGLQDESALAWILRETARGQSAPFQELQNADSPEASSPSDGLSLSASQGTSSPLSIPPSLRRLEGPKALVGNRLGRRFWKRVGLGSQVSWQRRNRFFPLPEESSEDAAERALLFTQRGKHSSSLLSHSASREGIRKAKKAADDEYMTVDLTNRQHVAMLSAALQLQSAISPSNPDSTEPLKRHRLWLPYILGDTVESVDALEKTLTVNAPPELAD